MAAETREWLARRAWRARRIERDSRGPAGSSDPPLRLRNSTCGRPPMSTRYAMAHIDQIAEITDGRQPWRPVRHHFHITAFGVNTWTGHDAGDRILNEHDEEGENEELYLV